MATLSHTELKLSTVGKPVVNNDLTAYVMLQNVNPSKEKSRIQSRSTEVATASIQALLQMMNDTS